MKLADRNLLFRLLVRCPAEHFPAVAAGLPAATAEHSADPCAAHDPLGAGYYVHDAYPGLDACAACVARSRAAAEIGRAGGLVGGKVMSPKKQRAFKRAAARRWPRKR